MPRQSKFLGVVKKVLQSAADKTGVTDLPPAKAGIERQDVEKWQREKGGHALAGFDLRYADAAAMDALANHLGPIIEKELGGVIREDMLPTFLAGLLESTDDAELIDAFRGMVSPQHLAMLENAATAARLRDLGKPEASVALINGSVRRFGEDARKINNLYATGYIRNFFLYHLCYMEAFSNQGAPAMFRAFFERSLRFFDAAIFVNHEHTEPKIKDEIEKRLRPTAGTRRSNVQLWAASRDNIVEARDAVESWIRDNPGYTYQAFRGSYGAAVSCMIHLFHAKTHPDLRPQRLERFPEWLDG